MPVDKSVSLNDEQRVVFMDAISESLRISQHSHLFNWLQGAFQYLLAHEVMIYGIKTSDSDSYEYEYLTSSRYFDEYKFHEAIRQEDGMANQILQLWQQDALPLLISSALNADDYANCAIYNFDETKLKHSELTNMIAHGFGDQHSKISTFVVFARLSKQPSASHAHILELIMPHLHCALVRVVSGKNNYVQDIRKKSNKITGRESEILHWVHLGKTNWEISSILDISPLTVKNHVQNILRKLDVQNRGQAAIKAAKLGLVRILK
jgi:transcriptional regulator EpsA